MSAPPPDRPVAIRRRPIVRDLGLRDYAAVFADMRRFTDARGAESRSEIWLVEHPPVFTQGQAGRPEHLLAAGDIPVVQSDRGGQVTYHGPGQLVVYLLLNLRELGMGIRSLVSAMEDAVIDLLAAYGLDAVARPDAPGVYVDGRKVCSLGLRVRRGNTYHGLALNVDMDLEPFQRINPCGHPGMQVTRLHDLGVNESVAEVAARLLPLLQTRLGVGVSAPD